MSSHTYYIQAHNSKVAEKLNKILKQFDAFKHTLTGFSNKDEIDLSSSAKI